MDIKFSFSKYILKPIIATGIMSVCSYAIYLGISSIFPGKIATILAIGIAVVVYILAVIALKIFTKDEMFMIPYGQKIYKLLEKIGIYKEQKTV